MGGGQERHASCLLATLGHVSFPCVARRVQLGVPEARVVRILIAELWGGYFEKSLFELSFL